MGEGVEREKEERRGRKRSSVSVKVAAAAAEAETSKLDLMKSRFVFADFRSVDREVIRGRQQQAAAEITDPEIKHQFSPDLTNEMVLTSIYDSTRIFSHCLLVADRPAGRQTTKKDIQLSKLA